MAHQPGTAVPLADGAAERAARAAAPEPAQIHSLAIELRARYLAQLSMKFTWYRVFLTHSTRDVKIGKHACKGKTCYKSLYYNAGGQEKCYNISLSLKFVKHVLTLTICRNTTLHTLLPRIPATYHKAEASSHFYK